MSEHCRQEKLNKNWKLVEYKHQHKINTKIIERYNVFIKILSHILSKNANQKKTMTTEWNSPSRKYEFKFHTSCPFVLPEPRI